MFLRRAAQIVAANTAFLGSVYVAKCDDVMKKPIPDCANPACKSKADLLLAVMKHKGTGNDNKANPQKSNQTAAVNSDNFTSDIVQGCPVDKDELGKSTWNLIHTMAANYPEAPSADDILNARNFLNALSWLYPCPYCAEDFRKSLLESPPE